MLYIHLPYTLDRGGKTTKLEYQKIRANSNYEKKFMPGEGMYKIISVPIGW